MEFHGLTLDPFQADACRAIDEGRSVVVAAPTGCGKTLIAEYAIEKALAAGRRVFYTGPIKALSNQKYRDFTARWGADTVGIVTGDVSINPDAALVIMTTEIFRNSLFDGRGGDLDPLAWVIFDEVHYLGDADRGTVWEESIIFAPPHITFVCLSATVPNAEEFTDWLEHVRAAPVDYVLEPNRPVPLQPYLWLGGSPFAAPNLKGLQRQVQKFKRSSYDKERDSRSAITWLVKSRRTPALLFCFNRRQTEQTASALAHEGYAEEDDEVILLDTFDSAVAEHGLDPESSSVDNMRYLVSRGVAFHHAGLLPALKDIVERLFATGKVKVLCATETFALGVNMPAAAVVFDSLKKYNGVSVDWLLVREYTQMAGRAGRRGMDETGTVVALLEPRDYEPRALQRMFTGSSEALASSFNLSYASLCNLVSRVGDRIGETLEKSFAVHSGGSPSRRQRKMKRMRRALSDRLDILEARGYIHDFACTEKGDMMRRLNGFEVIGCEWYHEGVLDELDDEEIAILAMAAVFEKRRNDWYRRPNWDLLEERFAKAAEAINHWAELEAEVGLPSVKELDFHFTEAVRHWYKGGDFSGFGDATSAGEGDIVRSFLLCCQFLRQMGHVVPDPALSARLRGVRARLFRDAMDAESQLRRVSAL